MASLIEFSAEVSIVIHLTHLTHNDSDLGISIILFTEGKPRGTQTRWLVEGAQNLGF